MPEQKQETIEMRWDVIANLDCGGTAELLQYQFVTIREKGINSNWLLSPDGALLGSVTNREADRLCLEAGSI